MGKDNYCYIVFEEIEIDCDYADRFCYQYEPEFIFTDEVEFKKYLANCLIRSIKKYWDPPLGENNSYYEKEWNKIKNECIKLDNLDFNIDDYQYNYSENHLVYWKRVPIYQADNKGINNE